MDEGRVFPQIGRRAEEDAPPGAGVARIRIQPAARSQERTIPRDLLFGSATGACLCRLHRRGVTAGSAFGADCFGGSRATGRRTSTLRAGVGLFRQRVMRRSAGSFAFQRLLRGFRPPGIRLSPLRFGRLPTRRRRDVDPSLPRPRKADGDDLFGGSRSVLAVAHVLDFLPHIVTGARGGRTRLWGRFGPAFGGHGYRLPEASQGLVSVSSQYGVAW